MVLGRLIDYHMILSIESERLSEWKESHRSYNATLEKVMPGTGYKESRTV